MIKIKNTNTGMIKKNFGLWPFCEDTKIYRILVSLFDLYLSH